MTITPETPIGEVLPAETIRRLAAFWEDGGTGKVVLNCQERYVMMDEITSVSRNKRAEGKNLTDH